MQQAGLRADSIEVAWSTLFAAAVRAAKEEQRVPDDGGLPAAIRKAFLTSSARMDRVAKGWVGTHGRGRPTEWVLLGIQLRHVYEVVRENPTWSWPVPWGKRLPHPEWRTTEKTRGLSVAHKLPILLYADGPHANRPYPYLHVWDSGVDWRWLNTLTHASGRATNSYSACIIAEDNLMEALSTLQRFARLAEPKAARYRRW